MNKDLLSNVNERICDRTDCFYWQTDRQITVEEQADIWKDRHSAISNDELLEKINSRNDGLILSYIEPFDEKAQTSQGNVNSARVGVLENGQEVVIRCHPKGLRNGYFYSESLAAKLAKSSGIPAYDTYAIHNAEDENDIAYQVIERIKGDTVSSYLKEHPENEEQLVYEMGKTMAKMHKIEVNGFGPFDNEKAQNGILQGRHSTLELAVNAGLKENLERLVKYGIISSREAKQMGELFKNNKLLKCDKAVLVHNDFADWNLLTDGKTITGVVDWDECVGGSPIEEIACWSIFFEPERIKPFLKGYFSETEKYDNFDETLQLMRLRYVISKMALRVKRYSYDKSEFLSKLINNGKKHLAELIDYFDLSDEKDIEEK